MNLYTILLPDSVNHFYVDQIKEECPELAIEKFINKMLSRLKIENKGFMENPYKMKKAEENCWIIEADLPSGISVLVVIKTDQNPEPIYDLEKVVEFIRATIGHKLITDGKIKYILNMENEYIIKENEIKCPDEHILKGSDEFNEFDQDKMIGFIRQEALKNNLKISFNIIKIILNLEIIYMQSIGIIEHEKIIVQGLEFNRPCIN